MIKGLHHNAYRCRDSEETRAFYEDFLSLRLVSAFEIERPINNDRPHTRTTDNANAISIHVLTASRVDASAASASRYSRSTL